MSQFIKAADIDQIPEGESYVVVLGGREIAIFNWKGKYYAVENSCPHRGGPVAEGELEDGIISCPWHAWPFDLRTGECKINSAAKLETFALKIEDGQLLVEMKVELGD